MTRMIIVMIVGCLLGGCEANKPETRLASLLVQQLKYTHDTQDWFVPVKKAIAGLNPEQATWKDSTTNHSIMEIVAHLVFWNERILKAFNGEEVADFDGDNEITFLTPKADWARTMMKLDSIQQVWELVVEASTDEQIESWFTEINNMASHTAYHTGQIIYIRKSKGWWK